MAQQPGLKWMNLFSATATSLGADAKVFVGPLSNDITIRNFVFSTDTPTGTSPVLAVDANDAGAAGTGTTAVADRVSAAVTKPGFVLAANIVGGSNGYLLSAGSVLTVFIDTGGTTPVFPGATLIMEFVEGVG